MKNRFLVVLLALICALSMAGLVACSGGNAAQSSSQAESSATASDAAASSAAATEDEAAIKQDAEKVVSTMFGKDSIETMFNANESLAQLKDLGFDISKLADFISGLITSEVTNVKVDGETAVATIKISYPEWNDEVSAALQEKATAALEGIDFDGMSQEDAMSAYMDAYFSAIESTEFPQVSEELTIDYLKDGDTWKMKDGENFQEELVSVASTLGGSSSSSGA